MRRKKKKTRVAEPGTAPSVVEAHHYTEALALGDAQEAIMKKVMQMPDIEKNWDSVAVEEKILSLL